MASVKNRKRSGKAGETASELVASEKGSVKPLEPKPEVADKSVVQNSTPGKDAGTSQQVQHRNKNKRKRRKERARETKHDASDAETASKHIASEMPTVSFLKPEPQITDRSVAENNVLGKGAGNNQEAQDRNKNKRQNGKEREKETKHGQGNGEKNLISHRENIGKEKLTEKHEEMDKRTHTARKELGGVIFLCNGKTKQDCFRYRIMGVSSSKKELVLSIRPGLKLFLYDFDLKLMYGIYKASSAGGIKLEPAAFGGAFPFQVRFDVEKDCLPLPESVFKRALRDSYNERTRKFNTELTFEQVKHLSKVFQPAPQLQPNVKSFFPEPVMVLPIRPPLAVTSSNEEIFREQVYRDHYSGREARGGVVTLEHDTKQLPEQYGSHGEVPSHPLFFGEREYRSRGLQPDRHRSHGLQTDRLPLPTVSAVGFDYVSGQEREQLQRDTASANGDAVLLHKEARHPDPFFLTETEYRTYGLRGGPRLPTVAPIAETNLALEDRRSKLCNPYDESTTSLVNRYLSMPRMTEVDPGSYSLAEREAYRNGAREAYRNGSREAYRNDSIEAYRNDSNYINERRGQPESYIVDRQKEYSSYDPRAPPDYNQRHLHLGGEPDRVPATVSSRYAFSSPSDSRR